MQATYGRRLECLRKRMGWRRKETQKRYTETFSPPNPAAYVATARPQQSGAAVHTSTFCLQYLTLTARARVSSVIEPSSLFRGRFRSALTKTAWFLSEISLASCWMVFFLVGALLSVLAPRPHRQTGAVTDLAAERNASILSSLTTKTGCARGRGSRCNYTGELANKR